MLRYIFLSVAISCAYAQLHNVCHTNEHDWPEARVVTHLSGLCDRNNNGLISEPEIVVCFADILEAELPLSEAQILGLNYDSLLELTRSHGFFISRQDFIDRWHARFHDGRDFIGATFDAFDNNGDGEWGIQEVDDILNHLLDSVDNGDGLISRSEFIIFFTDIYENC